MWFYCPKIDVFAQKQRFRVGFQLKTHVIPSFMESKSFQNELREFSMLRNNIT